MADTYFEDGTEITALTGDEAIPATGDPAGTPYDAYFTPSTMRQYNEWTPATGTWTYASTTTITVPSGAASIYSVGDKLKMTNSGTKYNYVVAVADTLLTVRGNGVANAAITAPYFSKSVSPVGFPNTFTYTPTGIAASNVSISGRYSLNGRICKVFIYFSFTGAITFTTMPTLPITASTILWGSVIFTPMGTGGYFDASVGPVPGGIYPSFTSSATTVTISKTTDGTAMSATNPITWANGDAGMVTFEYEI